MKANSRNNTTVKNGFLDSFDTLIVSCVFLFLLLLLVYLPIFFSFPGRDSGVFLYAAQRIMEGKLPYIDFWDHKPPLIYLINALGLFLGRGSVTGVRVVEFFSLFTAVICGLFALRIVFGIIPSFLASAIWILNLPMVLETGNFTEEYGLLCQFGAILLFVCAEKKRDYSVLGLGIGLLLGIAFFLKQNLVGVWVSIALFFLYELVAEKDWYATRRKIFPIVLGSLPIILAIPGFFAINHGLYQFWDNVFFYNFAYSTGRSSLLRFQAICSGMGSFPGWVSLVVVGSWFLAIYCVKYGSIKNRLMRSFLIVSIFLFPTELLLSSISGRHYDHYFLTYLPFISIFSAFLVHICLRHGTRTFSFTKSINIRSGHILVFLLVMTASFTQSKEVYREFRGNIMHRQQDVKEKVINYVCATTVKNDFVLVWGDEPIINFYSNRRSPSRFFYQYPLFTKNYTNDNLVMNFIRDIKTHRPELIVDTMSKILPPIDKLDRTVWKVAKRANTYGYLKKPPTICKFYNLVQTQYKLDKKLNGWKIYRRKSHQNMRDLFHLFPEFVKMSSASIGFRLLLRNLLAPSTCMETARHV